MNDSSTMPLFYRKLEETDGSLVHCAILNTVYVSGLRYYKSRSGKRNRSKHDWRGFIPQGAVQAELDKHDDYEGLPVPELLINACPELHKNYKFFHEKKYGHHAPYYMVALDSISDTFLIVAIPLGPCSDGSLSRRISCGTIKKLMPETKEPGAHSLKIDKLHVLARPVRMHTDRHDRGVVIPTPWLDLDAIGKREAMKEKIKLLSGCDEIPQDALKKPFFSVFYDSSGLFLFFPVHPKEREPFPGPDGIVEAPGFEWLRRRQLNLVLSKKSLKYFSGEDSDDLRRDREDDDATSLSERPQYPNTMRNWIRDK